MIKLKHLVSESVWDRKFGEPLPTLTDVMNKKDCDLAIKTSGDFMLYFDSPNTNEVKKSSIAIIPT